MIRRALAALLLAAAAFDAPAAGMGYADARHLLNRTGFGAADAEVRAHAALSREAAVDRLLAAVRTEAVTPPPETAAGPYVPYRRLDGLSAEERMAAQRERFERALALRTWWLREMLATPSPLTERMTLFWHNHFATSEQKVRSDVLLYRQNALLRREALGDFGALLRAVSRDPAMLVYLDNARSRREAPNENFAREVMELFTLGEGRGYDEGDIRDAARAFTGWSVDPRSGAFVQRPAWHDRGMKRVLGTAGMLDGDAVLGLLLARPETAEHIVGKLWREFVSPEPDAALVRAWASRFRAEGYAIKPLLRTLLLSDAFWDARHRGAVIKSPVDLIVGALRTFELQPAELRPVAIGCAMLGQNLFAPPNVKGWPGGEAWVDAASLLARKQVMDRMLRGTRADAAPGRDLTRWVARVEDGAGGRLEALLLAIPAVNPADDAEPEARLRRLIHDPAFQLR